MRPLPPPFRFLLLVVGGWVCVRAAILTAPWQAAPEPAASPSRIAEAPAPGPAAKVATPEAPAPAIAISSMEHSLSPAREDIAPLAQALREAAPPPVSRPWFTAAPGKEAARLPDQALAGLASWQNEQGADRWSASGWLFIRDTETVALAPGGMLGGSQAGGRLLYRLGEAGSGKVALSLRAYAPLTDRHAAEVAAGVDWQPSELVPVHLLLERRQALGGSGRSAFSLTAYGGVSDVPVGPARLDAYGQAGVAGVRSRDLFADGSARLSVPAGRIKLGGGIWAAAQPGVSRVDMGPQASVFIPAGGASVTIAADWRFRVAGDAEPGSGPTLTIATDF